MKTDKELAEELKKVLTASDRRVEKMMRDLDGKVQAMIKENNNVDYKAQDFDLQTQAAIPVSLALKAVHYGAAKIIFRVMPRLTIAYLEKIRDNFIGKSLAGLIGFTALKKIPLAGNILGILAAEKNEATFNAGVVELIRENLGTDKSVGDIEPMRWALNKHVELMKRRTAREPRRKDPVKTRNPDGRYK